MTIKPLIRKQAMRADGSTSIYLRVTIDRRAICKSTDITIQAKNWCSKTLQVKKSEPLAGNITLALAGMLSRMHEKYLELLREQKPVTHAQIFAAMKYGTITKFREYALDEIKSRPVNEHHKTTLRATVEMFEEYRRGLSLNEITPAILEGFRSFIIARDYSHNYQKNILSRLRSILRAAWRNNVIKENPFAFVKIGAYKSRKEFLSYAELCDIIANLHKLPRHQAELMQRFCFCCCSSFRYSDAESLDYKNLRVCDRGYYFLITQQKTDEQTIVPLNNLAMRFIDPEQRQGKVFKSYTNQYMNRELKKAFAALGITRKITTHVARHSFITITQEKGGSKAIAGKIAGHKSESTTAGYSHYDLNTLFDAVQKWN